jgi:hypothetical protein
LGASNVVGGRLRASAVVGLIYSLALA